MLREPSDDNYDLLENLLQHFNMGEKLETCKQAIIDDLLDGIHSGDLFLTTKNALKEFLQTK